MPDEGAKYDQLIEINLDEVSSVHIILASFSMHVQLNFCQYTLHVHKPFSLSVGASCEWSLHS